MSGAHAVGESQRQAWIGAGTSAAATAMTALVAVLTMVTLELTRTSGPLIDLAFTRGEVPGATGSALVTYVAPGLVLALLMVLRHRPATALLVGSVALATLRIVVQGLSGDARFFVGLATVSVAVAVLTLAAALLAGQRGGAGVAFAVAAGAAAAVGLQLALGTWDAYWRSDLLGWTVSAVVVGAMVALALVAAREPEKLGDPGVRRLWALGPLLALLLMVLANPAFATSQAGLPQVVAGPVHGLGLLLAAWAVTRTGRVPALLAGLGLPVLVAATMLLGGRFAYDGVLVLLAILGAQVCAVLSLAHAVQVGPDSGAPTLRTRLAGTAALVGLGTILPPMLYQVSYEVPLGFPNELALVAAALVLGLAGLRRSAVPGRQLAGARQPMLAAAALVAVGAVVAGIGALTTQPQPKDDEQSAGRGNGVVMLWNIHYGVDGTGALDPESVARVIEELDPDVVVLNEISSGWVLGGGMDVGTWLSQRLDRRLVFGPAADRQFGTGLLSRWDMEDVELHDLPQGDGSQDRSAVSARVDLGGRTVRVVGVQLQNKAANAPTRALQVEALLNDTSIRDEAPLVVAGDLNANPGTDVIEVLEAARLVSAVDAVGDPDALTYPASDPEQRLDWVFGRAVRFEDAVVLEGVTQTDHLPVLVTLAP